MLLNLEQFTTDLLTMGIGGVSTGLLWVIKSILKQQKDLDAAHAAIREMRKNGTNRSHAGKDRCVDASEVRNGELHCSGDCTCAQKVGSNERDEAR